MNHGVFVNSWATGFAQIHLQSVFKHNAKSGPLTSLIFEQIQEIKKVNMENPR